MSETIELQLADANDEIEALRTIVEKLRGQLDDAIEERDEAWKALGGDLTGSLSEAIGRLHKILAETREQRDRALGLVDRSAALLDIAVRPDIHARVVRERDALLDEVARLKKRERYHVQGRTLREWADLIEFADLIEGKEG